jgi:type VI secretion system protein ImpL
VKAYYELFVIARIDEKIDETQPSTRENLKYPPISADSVFEDRPEILGDNGVLSSKRLKYEGKYGEVRGPYTLEGFKTIDKLLSDEGAKLLEREAWVVPYSRDEKLQGDNIKKSLRRVRQRYEDDYISEWKEFFRDLDVKVPVANGEAIREYRLLSTPEWAYRRLLQTLSDNTQFATANTAKLGSTVAGKGGVIDQVQKRVERRFEAQSGVKVDELQAMRDVSSQDRIKKVFESMVGFGVAKPYVPPPPTSDGTAAQAPKPPPDPELAKYVGHLETLASEMQIVEEGPPDSDPKKATELFTAAVKESEAMVLRLDKVGQELMEPLLMNPLRQGYKAYLRGAGGAASGLWEVMVWPHYRDKIKDRYPFNLAAKRDASYEDTVAFFKPKEGVLWSFYERYLAGMHRKQEHQYVPIAHLQGKVAKGKPYTPFSPLMYSCLERADEITDALWPGGAGDEPNVQFQINLKTVSPIVSHVVFEVDGQRREYRNEKEFFYEFKWPGGESKGARIQVRGAGGLDEQIVREGPWGIFRLLEAADKLTAVKDSDREFLATWTMSAPPVSVTMQVRPRRGNHPFPLSFFRATNCPSSIGDKFGGQAKN